MKIKRRKGERSSSILFLSYNKKRFVCMCVNVDVCDLYSDKTLGSIIAKFCTQVLLRKISVKLLNGQNRFKPFKMGAILNT